MKVDMKYGGRLCKVIPTCCNACGGQTGVLAHVVDGKVVKLEPNSENPIGVANTYEEFITEKPRGARMCPKGLSAVKQLYDPGRLTKPLRRKGEKGWQELTWEEALDLAAEKLEKIRDVHGPETLLWFSEDHSFTHIQQDFCRAYGTPNYMNHANLCDVARKAGYKLTLGDERPIADIARAKYILSFGWNPLAATKWAYLPAAFIKALEAGAKLVVVDPVFTATAAKAAEWVPIRPGTDGAMALAMGHVIVQEGLYDQEFVDNWSTGFDRYKEFVADKTPGWAEDITGVPAETIVRLARELAGTKPAVVDTWSGVSHYSNGTEATRAIAMLLGLTGQIDGPGMMLLPERVQPKHRAPLAEWPKITAPRVDGLGTKYPFAHKSGVYVEAREAMLTGEPYQPRAAVFVFQNFVMSMPNIEKTIKALRKMDFVMVVDPYLSETALEADLVAFPSISLRQPVVEPPEGVRPEYELVMALARKLGLPGFDMSYESLLDAELRGSAALGLEEVKALPGGVWNQGPTKYYKYREKGFATSSGKFEFYSLKMKEAGFPPLPETAGLKPQGPAGYPLAIINWKCMEHTHSRTHNNPWLMEMEGSNPLFMHPWTAEELGLQDGDLILVESPYARKEAIVKVTQEIHPGAVGMTHGFGHWGLGKVARNRGTAVNHFYEGKADKLSGQAIIKEGWVRVSKREGQNGQDSL
ncbi:MAG: molybdopterin-dependent oxidoreductase [Clostridia bacterium]|nr:molybdopterin-dependent oxidoreductase [Clostridia bacterium]